jgi:hypothetical protein
MSNPMQSVKLGQSLFQDTFFVANAQLTPYRKLRQIELELNELDSSIKRANFQLRRQEVNKKDLENKLRLPQHALSAYDNKELLEIDLEELELSIEQTKRLLEDAEHRRDNFLLLREQLLNSVPQEYWDQGFENAELENWTKYFSKQLQISILTGVPNTQLLEQISQLPEPMIKKILLEGKALAQGFALLDQSTAGELK